MNDYKELIAIAENCMDINMECRNCNCPYEGVSVVNDFCMNHLADDLVKAIEQLVRERDAAVKDITRNCPSCKHSYLNNPDMAGICKYSEICDIHGSKWEWRGVQDEQTN